MNEVTERPNGHKRIKLICPKGGRTQQHFKKACDINNILKKYEQTGILPEARETVQANYGDFSNLEDYQSGLNIVIKARETFEKLDWRTRERFSNDPAKMVAFCENDDNYEEAVKLGFIEKTPVPSEPPQGEKDRSKLASRDTIEKGKEQ